MPALPLSIDLQALRIDKIRLGEALTERPGTISADLALSVSDEAATAAGWIETSTTEGAARVDLDLAVVPDDGTLKAEITAS